MTVWFKVLHGTEHSSRRSENRQKLTVCCWEMSSLGEHWTDRSELSSQWTAEFLESLPVWVILSLSSWHFYFSICVTKYTLAMLRSSEMEGKGFWWSFMLHGLLWGILFSIILFCGRESLSFVPQYKPEN